MNSIFIDTNILLHFRTFDELPFKTLISGEFKLIFPPIILDELDKHKNNQNTKTARRSRMIATKLVEIIQGKSKLSNAEIFSDRPKPAVFKKYNLDPKHQDDCLLASILLYINLHSEENVLLITDDLMALARAGTFGIQTINLGEEFRLVEGANEQTKLIEQLKKENSQLMEKIPKVDLYFEGMLQVLKVQVNTSIKSREEISDAAMKNIMRDNPLMEITDQKEAQTAIEIIASYSSSDLSNDRKQAYNKELEDFYTAYRQYRKIYYDYAVKTFQSLELKFMIANQGNIPAEDIDVWVHLPDGFEASGKELKAPKEPSPPYRPKHQYDMEQHSFSFESLAAGLKPNRSAPVINFDAPSIRKTNSYEITYHCRMLKHDMQNSFDSIFLTYSSFRAMENFTIDYKLNISNVPAPVTGKLHVVFNKE